MKAIQIEAYGNPTEVVKVVDPAKTTPIVIQVSCILFASL
jgi:hypothetical protein